MAGVDEAPPAPTLTPVAAPGRGPSAWVALGLITVALVALVGISLVGQSGGGAGPQAAGDGPRAMATGAASPSATGMPVATISPTAPPGPPAGTPPRRVAVAVGPVPTCPPGSTPNSPGPAEQARPLGLSAMAFDRQAGRLVALAGTDAGFETWTFDVCTNTWTRMHPNQEPPGLSVFGQMIYDVDSGVTIALDGTRVWAYDLAADTWTEKGSAPAADPRLALRLYDPVSGLVLATGDDGDPDTPGSELWSYEVETNGWTAIPQGNRLATEPREYAYDASVDRIVAYTDAGGRPSGARTWLFDLRRGTWSGTGAVSPEFSYGWFGTQPAIAYDEAAERTVMAGQGCHVVAYDATADRWETPFLPAPASIPALEPAPECRDGQQIVYDPVNVRLVAYGGTVYTTCTDPRREGDAPRRTVLHPRRRRGRRALVEHAARGPGNRRRRDLPARVPAVDRRHRVVGGDDRGPGIPGVGRDRPRRPLRAGRGGGPGGRQ